MLGCYEFCIECLCYICVWMISGMKTPRLVKNILENKDPTILKLVTTHVNTQSAQLYKHNISTNLYYDYWIILLTEQGMQEDIKSVVKFV